MNFRPTTPREKVIRCVTLQMKTTCEKRKQRIEMIKENIITKENARRDEYFSRPEVVEMYQKRNEINKKYLNL
jgi:hypothetical protein